MTSLSMGRKTQPSNQPNNCCIKTFRHRRWTNSLWHRGAILCVLSYELNPWQLFSHIIKLATVYSSILYQDVSPYEIKTLFSHNAKPYYSMLGGCAVFCTDHWYCESSGIVIQTNCQWVMFIWFLKNFAKKVQKAALIVVDDLSLLTTAKGYR